MSRRGSKYDCITGFAAALAAETDPETCYRRCTREGGCYDNLECIVQYQARRSADGTWRWWSLGEVVSLIPSYIKTPDLCDGSAHRRALDTDELAALGNRAN